MATLQPLDVPWQISPSMPDLCIRTKTFDGVNHGFVTFTGFLGEDTDLSRKHGGYRQIAVILENIVSLLMYPEFSSVDKERLQSYDWEKTLRFQDKENGFRNHYRTFHDQWNSTQKCSDPSAYVVEDSDWLLQLGFADDAPPHLQFQHYMFIGNDSNVEVIAKAWKWQIVGEDVELPSLESIAESGIRMAGWH